MKKKLACLVSALLMTFLFWSNAYAASPHLFKDTTGLWWEQSVAECSAANIVGGRGNGLFAPKDSVTRAEAIVFLNRALGHRSEADNYNMAPGGYNFPKDFPEWAKRNVAFAADKGYISKPGIPNMQPKQAASRQEIAVLFANALKLSADGYELTFKDKDAIDPSMKSFVAAAVKHGVMSGKTTELFDPKANVTRGEMAAIVARLFEKGMINPAPDKFFIGKLSAVDVNGKKITVTKGGQAQTYSVDADTLYYRDGKKVGLGLFKANENVKVALDNANKVAVLVYTTANPTTSSGGAVATTTYTGTIQSIMSNPLAVSFKLDAGSINSYPLSTSVVIKQNGLVKDLTALASGTKAEIKVVNGNVTEINLLNTVSSGKELKGYVVNVYLDYLTVRYDDGTHEQLQRLSNVNFYGIERGQRITLTKTDNLITSISSLNETRKIFGYVESVGSSRITIEDLDGYERTVDLANNYRVRDEDGDSIDLDDLDRGDNIEIELNDKGEGKLIKLTSGSSSKSSDLEGEITYIKTSGNYRITIKKYDGSEKTYDVKDNVEVYQDDRKREFNRLYEKDFVKLKLDSSDRVTRIDILNVEVIEGKVTHIDTYDYTIEIENSNGRRTEYDVSSNVKVWEDSKSRTLRNIRSGDKVRLILDNKRYVTVINLGDSSSSSDGSYTGTIYSLDIDDDKIVIEKNGKKTTYILDDDVVVRKNDNGNYLDKLIIGSEVEIKVEKGKVTRIDVDNYERITLKGTLTKISAGRVYIEQDNGTRGGLRITMLLSDRATLRDSRDRSLDISDLGRYVGDEVEFEIRKDEIDYLKIL
ncbi:S-layer homology domain-containing protein [Desulforamulus ferrireducens]|uniref:S-layer protein n=1 Tax=Desulforamulus ferrireducens TaxID=1833852 RepID=A0A1S6IZJ7_9FIRM|nr:S-layer homology domain-containing protein [Desulforamulus ferrireducens]AQS60198.1 S-layer protein [Desulforamulus ferrireducens]